MFPLKAVTRSCQSVPYWTSYENWQLQTLCLLHITVIGLKTKPKQQEKPQMILFFAALQDS